MNRRTLLKTTLHGAAATALGGGHALSAQKSIGANERINVGLIGCGGRGLLVSRLMAAVPNVSIVAFSDVCDDTVNRAAASPFAASGARAYKDFRGILDRHDVHAVIVATPDHWHAIPTVLACEAGKDVYVEKPLSLTIAEGRKMVTAARKHGRIVQHGTQHRAAPHYQEIEQIVQRGDIGDVRFVRVWNYGPSKGAEGFPDSEVPPGVDWDMYLGPAPMVPFNRQRFQGGFRRFFDYSGGYITDFGAHRLDSVHHVMRDDRPLSVVANGAQYVKAGQSDTPDVIQVSYEYRNWRLSYEGIQLSTFGAGPRIPGGRVPYGANGPHSRPHGEAFYGTKGTIFSDRVGYEVFPADAREGVTKPSAEPRSVAGADRTDLHVLDFIESMRSRNMPLADVDAGHRSTVACLMANISYKLGGLKLAWDPDRERFDDVRANNLIDRPARKPWDLI